jgi:GcrA cell cycle regulator
MTSIVEWTDALVAHVTKAWNDGLSAGAIARQLGAPVTRNMILAKVHRLGLRRAQPRVLQIPAAEKIVAKTPPKPKSAPETPAERPPESMKSAGGKTIPLDRAPICEVVKIEFAPTHGCKWPSGDPGKQGFSFCGERVHVGPSAGGPVKFWPYCLGHCQIAYAKFGKAPEPKRANARERDTARRYG